MDLTFGENGFAPLNLSTTSDIAIQPDGKILVAGNIFWVKYTFFKWAVARLNTDGTPDLSFNETGYAIYGPANYEYLTSIALQADGKILMGGYATPGDLKYDFAICRLTSDGLKDNTFGDNSKILLPVSIGENRISNIFIDGTELYATGFANFANSIGIISRFNLAASGPLPLTLLGFNVSKKVTGRLVAWNTGNESNMRFYEVERSLLPNAGFVSISKLNAINGNSNAYTFTDADILSTDIIYYRLRITDADGNIKYSRIISIKNDLASLRVLIYHNPASRVLTISFTENIQNGIVRILNNQGAVVLSRNNVSGLKYTIDVNSESSLSASIAV